MRVSTRRCTRWSEEQARARPFPGNEGRGESRGGVARLLTVGWACWRASGLIFACRVRNLGLGDFQRFHKETGLERGFKTKTNFSGAKTRVCAHRETRAKTVGRCLVFY